MDMCDYTFIPSEWSSRYKIEPVPGVEVDCPIDRTLGGSDYCRYHCDNQWIFKNDLTEEEVFLQLTKEDKDIFGAKFQYIDLDKYDTQELGLAECELKNLIVHERFTIKDIDQTNNIKLNRCGLPRYKERNTTIDSNREFIHCRFSKSGTFDPKSTSGRIIFNNCRFEEPLVISGEFRESVKIENCMFYSGIGIQNATFHDMVHFKSGLEESELIIANTNFRDVLKFEYFDFPEISVFVNCGIETIDILANNEEISLIDFRTRSNIRSGWLRTGSNRNVHYDLSNVTIGSVNFDEDPNTLNNYYFEDTRFDGFDFLSHRNHFENSNFTLHEFRFPEESGIVNYNFNSDIYGYMNIEQLNNLQYNEKGRLKDQEETYSRAKNGAQAAGVNKFASEFFIKQKEAELLRTIHDISIEENEIEDTATESPTVNNGSSEGWVQEKKQSIISYCKEQKRRVDHYSEILRNDRDDYYTINKLRFLKWSCGYGEKPRNTVKVSLYIILASGLAYPFLGGVRSDQSISLGICFEGCLGIFEVLEILLNSMYFSGITFVTLSFNEFTPSSSGAQMLAMIEALLGTFFIALFVFTLGRQVSR